MYVPYRPHYAGACHGANTAFSLFIPDGVCPDWVGQDAWGLPAWGVGRSGNCNEMSGIVLFFFFMIGWDRIKKNTPVK
ncbi:hypothetical protein ATCC53582_01904 [Novacetimonas hansenii]|nr:hypothetical protein ATCC53582_01904 [Novacetimonas hansenii]